MPTLKIPTGNFTLTSSWTNTTDSSGKIKVARPSMSSHMVNFTYSLPSGATIKSAKVWATLGSPKTGCATCVVNGVPFMEKNGSERSARVNLRGNSGTFRVTFLFRANGNKTNAGQRQSGALSFTNVYLLIEYEGVPTPAPKPVAKRAQTDAFQVPPQNVAIYDQSDGAIYMFDGVTKIQHALSMDIQEEPDSKKKDKYVNNARNEPDKLTIDVVMSDVYTAGGAIISRAGSYSGTEQKASNATKSALTARDTSGGWTRSESAFHTLHKLKEERRKLSVITPQYVHTDMILSTVTVNQDDQNPFGWEGQLVFQHAFEQKAKKQDNSKKTNTGSSKPSESTFSSIINGVFSSASKAISSITSKSGSNKP